MNYLSSFFFFSASCIFEPKYPPAAIFKTASSPSSITLASFFNGTPTRYFITNNNLVTKTYGWKPKRNILKVVSDTFLWLKNNESKINKYF